MLVRSTSDGTSAVLPVLTVFIICCVLFSGTLFAFQAEESPVTESPAAMAVDAEQGAEPAVEEVKDPAALKLEETLKKNSKCLRCQKGTKPNSSKTVRKCPCKCIRKVTLLPHMVKSVVSVATGRLEIESILQKRPISPSPAYANIPLK